jgi:hypothetical protein
MKLLKRGKGALRSNYIVQGLMSLNLKLVKGTEIRKVENPPADLAGLSGLITSLFGITDFNIRYVDEEGDTITISTDIEVQLAYHEAHRFGLKSFKIYVDQRDLSDARSEAARQLELLAASHASLNKQNSESMHPDQHVTAIAASPLALFTGKDGRFLEEDKSTAPNPTTGEANSRPVPKLKVADRKDPGETSGRLVSHILTSGLPKERDSSFSSSSPPSKTEEDFFTPVPVLTRGFEDKPSQRFFIGTDLYKRPNLPS